MRPTFLVIGAMKAGTTSLHAQLAAHPEVFMATPKELDFFVAGKGWERGIGWYEERFAAAPPGALALGEASPNYTKDPMFGGVPERMRTVVPEARLVYVVRDPIERMRSHYAHHVASGGTAAPIAEAMLTEPHLRLCSSYAHQLDRYLEAGFDRSQVLVVTAESLRADPAATLARVLGFVGVDPAWSPDAGADLHRTDAKRVPRAAFRRRPELGVALERRAPDRLRPAVRTLTGRPLRPEELTVPPEVADELRAVLRPDVARLREWLGPDFDGWGLLDG